jgi:hypothetical protein
MHNEEKPIATAGFHIRQRDDGVGMLTAPLNGYWHESGGTNGQPCACFNLFTRFFDGGVPAPIHPSTLIEQKRRRLPK